MSETFGYRIGAVQALSTYMSVGDGALYKPGLIKRWIEGRNRIFEDYTDSKFSQSLVKKALKQMKEDYPGQRFRFGTFKQDNRVFLAIKPEHPTPSDQWMIIAPEVIV